MIKFRDILKGTILEERINLLVDNAKNKWLRDLGKNDFIHSNSVENKLDRLVPDKIKNDKDIFDEAEIFLLLYGVYLHDIGRRTNDNSHEKETYDKILENPEKYFLIEYEAEAVAEICHGHAKESEKPIKSISTKHGIEGLSDKLLNLQFLAALLRLADEIDNAYTRVQGVKGQEGKPRNLIRYINIDTRRRIIEFQCNVPISHEDWDGLQNMRDSAQERLDEIKDILELKGLLYHQIRLDFQRRPKEETKNLDKELKYDLDVNVAAKVGITVEADVVRKLENNPLNIRIRNQNVPYLKMMSKGDDCILFGDFVNLPDQTYYCYTLEFNMNLEKLESMLEIYYNTFRKGFAFNYPSFLVNQTCHKDNSGYSWFGYGYKNFIQTIKEKNRRYYDAGIMEPYRVETAGFVADGLDHVFYIALSHDIRRSTLEVEVGFVFENMPFDNKKYLEFYKNVGLEIPNFIYQDKNDDRQKTIFRRTDIELKEEGIITYEFEKDKEDWIYGIIYKNPFVDNNMLYELSQHDKIIVNISSHHPVVIKKQYYLRDARVIHIPTRSFKFEILNIKGDW